MSKSMEMIDAITQGCRNFFVDEGYSDVREDNWDMTIDDMMDYVVVEMDMTDERPFRPYIEVRAELSYDSFDRLITEYLDPIIQRYDREAYFEMYDPTIAQAYFDKRLIQL